MIGLGGAVDCVILYQLKCLEWCGGWLTTWRRHLPIIAKRPTPDEPQNLHYEETCHYIASHYLDYDAMPQADAVVACVSCVDHMSGRATHVMREYRINRQIFKHQMTTIWRCSVTNTSLEPYSLIFMSSGVRTRLSAGFTRLVGVYV